MTEHRKPEPWLRGTHAAVPAVQRAVLHALELADEDLWRWCGFLKHEQLNARPAGLAPVGFHLRHIARSLDRLLTYAEGRSLSDEQMALLRTESSEVSASEDVFNELRSALSSAAVRIRKFSPTELEQARVVGKKQLPSTVGGLLVHMADHTQRHVGQAIVTTKTLLAQEPKTAPRNPELSTDIR